jgi:hypothetical protein
MGNTEQAPSKRVRIVLCAAAFTLAAAVPGAGFAADWTSAKAKPTADWTSKVKGNADWTTARIKPNADWTSRVKPNADWSS